MDQRMEQSSDSDSDQLLNSWVFVEETSSSNTAVRKNFYLNCVKEPVEELNEHDLGSVYSDIESDTDGISVISESEENCSEQGLSLLKDSECIEQSHDLTSGVVPESKEMQMKKFISPTCIIGAGIMVLSIVLIQYFNDKEFSKMRVTKTYRSVLTPSNYSHKEQLSNEKNENYLTGTFTANSKNFGELKLACYCKHKNKKLNEYNNKYRREKYNFDRFKQKEKLLQAKEDYLNKREQFLIQKEHELLRKKSVDKQNTGNKITGNWYNTMHKGRNEIRNKEQISDWIFERANLRSTSRNKAQWYFQWMTNREKFRSKNCKS